jgi:hypothetical protein
MRWLTIFTQKKKWSLHWYEGFPLLKYQLQALSQKQCGGTILQAQWTKGLINNNKLKNPSRGEKLKSA